MNTFLDNEIVLLAHDGGHAELKAGQPALFLESAGKATLFEEPTRFLWDRYVSAGSTPSVHTWSKACPTMVVNSGKDAVCRPRWGGTEAIEGLPSLIPHAPSTFVQSSEHGSFFT